MISRWLPRENGFERVRQGRRGECLGKSVGKTNDPPRVQSRSAPVLDIFLRRYFDKLDRYLRAGLLVARKNDVAKTARINELDLLVLGTHEGVRVWLLCWHCDLLLRVPDAQRQDKDNIEPVSRTILMSGHDRSQSQSPFTGSLV
jgi:hypothetical protein